MDHRLSDLEKLKGAHLDNLIRVALRYEEALELQAFLNSDDRTPSDAERAACQRAYALFEQKLREKETADRRALRRRAWKKRLPRFVEIAACIVLVMGILTPIAVANIETLRAKVLRLLIQMEDTHAELSLIENTGAAFDVPGEWMGAYYPSYIPEGYEIKDIFPVSLSVEYENPEGKFFHFDECTADTFVNVDSEGATVRHADVNGQTATLFQKKQCIVVWANDERYFIVTTSESSDFALEIARSVKKIIK